MKYITLMLALFCLGFAADEIIDFYQLDEFKINDRKLLKTVDKSNSYYDIKMYYYENGLVRYSRIMDKKWLQDYDYCFNKKADSIISVHEFGHLGQIIQEGDEPKVKSENPLSFTYYERKFDFKNKICLSKELKVYKNDVVRQKFQEFLKMEFKKEEITDRDYKSCVETYIHNKKY